MSSHRSSELVKVFQSLADRTRLRLLNLLREGEICVCFFVEVLGEPQPKISRHLAYLRNAGLVEARRDGKWIHYRLTTPADPAIASLLDATFAAVEGEREMHRDRLALTKACCSPRLPAQLRRAPKPQLANS